jgi:hypothetical protein
MTASFLVSLFGRAVPSSVHIMLSVAHLRSSTSIGLNLICGQLQG